MARSSRRIFLMGLGAATLARGSRAQTGQTTLTGMVTYRGGNVANARLYIAREAKYRSYAVKFRGGRNVGYSIPGLVAGRHELFVVAPSAHPKRIWGVDLDTFGEKQVNVVLEPAAPANALFYQEEGIPIREDMPRNWVGGWLELRLLTEQGAPVEGTIKIYRGFTVAMEARMGTPILPAYFETRFLQPGTYDVLFVPSVTSKLKPVRIEKVTVEMNARTILEPVKVPAGFTTDAPVLVPCPERKITAVPISAPRRRRSG